MNAVAMVVRCFQHQHPEMYGRPDVGMEFPRESEMRAEPIPEGRNSEGWLLPPPNTVLPQEGV